MFHKDYASYYNLFNQEKKYKKEIQFLYDWAEKPKSILDIGCGTASYWDFFPPEVLICGIEKSASMIENSAHKEKIFQLEAKNIRELDFVPDFDLATCLFDVVNYIEDHKWWKDIPVKPGGYFIMDIWDKEKVSKDGFRETTKTFGNASRKISPLLIDGNSVLLEIEVNDSGKVFKENHKMFLYGKEDIERFCGDIFDIVEVKKTKDWQTFYKLRRK